MPKTCITVGQILVFQIFAKLVVDAFLVVIDWNFNNLMYIVQAQISQRKAEQNTPASGFYLMIEPTQKGKRNKNRGADNWRESPNSGRQQTAQITNQNKSGYNPVCPD